MRSVLVRGTAITLAPPCISSFHAVSWWLGLPAVRWIRYYVQSAWLTWWTEEGGGEKHSEQSSGFCEKGVGWGRQRGFHYQLAQLAEEEGKHGLRKLLLVRQDNIELSYHIFLLDLFHHELSHDPHDEYCIVGLPDEEAIFVDNWILKLWGAQQDHLQNSQCYESLMTLHSKWNTTFKSDTKLPVFRLLNKNLFFSSSV